MSNIDIILPFGLWDKWREQQPQLLRNGSWMTMVKMLIHDQSIKAALILLPAAKCQPLKWLSPRAVILKLPPDIQFAPPYVILASWKADIMRTLTEMMQ